MKNLTKYKIKDTDLLNKVFTHKSYTQSKENNEKLEFLGDAVLNLVVADFLMKKEVLMDEGELTQRRSQLVSGHNLAKIAKTLGLQNFLKTEKKSYTNNNRILSGVLEAYIGAFYLENQFESVKKMVEDIIQITTHKTLEINYKSILQEWCQKKYKNHPFYRVVKEQGVQHKKIFFAEVLIQSKNEGSGSSFQKKQAEQIAAKQAIKNLKIRELYT